MAANSMRPARRTRLIGAFPKMMFPFLVILPGLIALAASPARTGAGVRAESVIVGSAEAAPASGLIPYKVDESTGTLARDQNGKPQLDYDLAIPVMLLHYFPARILGLGLPPLLSTFMSRLPPHVPPL